MCTITRVRLKTPDGHFHVRDYTFSQLSEMTRSLSRDEYDRLTDGECVVVPEASIFAPAGTEIKEMYNV